ncbi:hypothetical protein MUK42_37700 [Musa troglodytarum]|uniref:Uncharacterized protein n=1 Tax=Musa troglodytarum TaxID=320322 RepID=A0A9E7JKP1_9LILI|nr:hypothetical protein MUK42_37700 [Musa troglodytarum]
MIDHTLVVKKQQRKFSSALEKTLHLKFLRAPSCFPGKIPQHLVLHLTPFRFSRTQKDATSGSALTLVPEENFV